MGPVVIRSQASFLLGAARRCPVDKTLTGEARIEAVPID